MTVKDPWVKAADKGMTAAFGTLVNSGTTDVTVVSAASAVSPMELHQMAMQDGKMVMRPQGGRPGDQGRRRARARAGRRPPDDDERRPAGEAGRRSDLHAGPGGRHEDRVQRGRQAVHRRRRELRAGSRLTRGEPALADTEAELSALPARLTVTFGFGFGPGLYRAAKLPAPVADLPGFTIDRLEPRWSGGDLLVQICADDPLTVTHAQRMLIKDALPFAAVRWVQPGFRRGRGIQDDTQTQRNVLGQLDGTKNPRTGTPAFDLAVWRPDGSSTVVVRRVRAEMELWDKLGRADKELAVGRRLGSGAPLSGQMKTDEPDFAKVDDTGLPVMPDFSHVTRAHVTDDSLRILRRPYNYDGAPGPDGRADSGLIFASYQADVARQFVPIQRRLAERDLLNEWITPIGSAVFAVPPGCAPGGWVGDQLLGED